MKISGYPRRGTHTVPPTSSWIGDGVGSGVQNPYCTPVGTVNYPWLFHIPDIQLFPPNLRRISGSPNLQANNQCVGKITKSLKIWLFSLRMCRENNQIFRKIWLFSLRIWLFSLRIWLFALRIWLFALRFWLFALSLGMCKLCKRRCVLLYFEFTLTFTHPFTKYIRSKMA